MRKNVNDLGLESLSPAEMLATNGGAASANAQLHANAKFALNAVLGRLTGNGANQKAIDAVTRNLGKVPGP